MDFSGNDTPWGLRCLEWILNKFCPHRRANKLAWHQAGILVLTYVGYTCYHLSRKSLSVVKTVLHLNCSTVSPPPNLIINDDNRYTWCDWKPFDTEDAPALLGVLDSAFLFAYAFSMFFSGILAERMNLRYYLSLGMIASGIASYLLGIAKIYNIHSLWYFVFVQALGGVFQSSGWPAVVTLVGNWFGRGKRGLLFGVWNSHTSIGNILGTIIATAFITTNWGLSFIVPAIIISSVGFIIFLFLAPHPKDVGCITPDMHGYKKLDATNSSDEGMSGDDLERTQENDGDDSEGIRSETSPMLSVNQRMQQDNGNRAIGFFGAVKIPGVREYSISLFFSKLVIYTFMYWLPLYINSSTEYGATLSAYISVLFDVGGIIGAILAGILADYCGMSAVTCAGMLLTAIPLLFIYDHAGNSSFTLNVILLLIAGIMVSGPPALISTAVAADLGTHPNLSEGSKALATVTAIIDGTGSIGAALGPLLAGVVSRWAGWHNVFYMLMTADFFALLFLLRLVFKDLRLYRQRRLVV
ncbi:glucose-6-phosphate exchanger SLC37A2 isoform X2 [Chelonus insularis]|uniref:glucose-6-phosphate exchanger SLC37A2 isoform X2 n=1 Tax=Chelonus insularis TaxID=460826 RepID=UPI00158F18CD|nr:glucose-6-phosphate exchanger SLC37A2 isoform X2 [Chelonus insularis]